MLRLALLAAATLVLPGCAASIAASAVGAAVRAATPERPEVTEDRRAVAVAACRAGGPREAEAVTIIDSEQRRDGRVTVYGTVTLRGERRSFKCVFDRSVRSFRHRPIPRS